MKEHIAKQNKEYRNRPDVRERYLRNRKKYNDRPEIKKRHQNYILQRQYGISIIDKQIILDGQEGLCAICGKELNGDQNTHVDHDHKTDAVRGILCSNCNFMLGQAKDSIDILCKAINYLEKYI